MASEISSDENVCRLCDKNTSNLYSIFEQNSSGQQIIQLIKECLPLIIYRRDPLSKQACKTCVENLTCFSSFRRSVLEIARKQKERLVNSHATSNSIELYLGQLNGENDDDDDADKSIKHSDIPTKLDVTERSTSPLENGQSINLCTNCKTCIAEPESNEIEMCAELHKAIADSLKKNNQHIQDNSNIESQRKSDLRNKRKRNEGFYTEFDDSQHSSVTTDFTYTESTQNTESQSDMELCESDQEFTPRIVTTENAEKPVVKRRRLMGPKCVQEYNDKLSIQRATEMEDTIVHNPVSLLKLVLNKINCMNVPDFISVNSEQSILKNECNYCHEVFSNIKLLAVHEAKHIHIELGLKIDDPDLWDPTREDADIRNKWLEKLQEVMEGVGKEENEGDLLVPVSADADTTQSLKDEVTLINGKPTVNGVLLSELPKDERRTLYRNMTISGVKRKFCPLCRYTFKDNWAIESHYFSSSCFYTCRYCGIRFNKQRYQFDEHIKQHQAKGDEPSTKVFAPRKWNGAFPKVVSETKLKPRTPPKLRPPISKEKPMNMKHLLERKSLQPNLRLKADESAGGHTPSNQAYFCRKCYQVFFKLDEFNTHVSACSGTQPQLAHNTNKTAGHLKTTSSSSSQRSISNTSANSDTEVYSSAGRPIRHCVKEVATYRDELDIDNAIEKYNRLGHTKSTKGYECGLCSAAFPTVHSRNSHMRIHKNDEFKTNNINNQPNDRVDHMAELADEEIPTFSSYINDPQIKQEPLEPIVEINENPHNFPSSIGSVSITPIPKPGMNPNIMKLVQNNPHLTIKSMSNNSHSTPTSSLSNFSGIEPDKTYKCANCSKTFGNKSHLYFHKKNQCGGSKYPCPFCKKRFGTEAAYSSHIFYSHPE